MQGLQRLNIWNIKKLMLSLLYKLCFMMNQIEQFIKVRKAYVDALSKLDKNHQEDVAHLLEIFDCVHPDPGYHLGVYIEKPSPNDTPTHRCDQAWFVCYKGKYSPIIRQPYRSKHGGVYHLGDMCYLRFTFDFFNHLYVEPTVMGAWQAYLLSIGKTLLPFSGGLYYTKRELVFCHDQLEKIQIIDWEELKHGELDCIRHPELTDLTVDISPSVSFDGKHVVVSCCHWNDWGGLIRESAKITFFNGKVYLLEDFDEQVLFKYNCGIHF